MDIIQFDKATGKTTRLIKEAQEKNLYIVWFNRQRADILYRMACDMGLYIKYPIVYDKIHSMSRTRFIKEVLVDDLEDILQLCIGLPIVTATTSCNVEYIEPFTISA